MDNVVYAVSSGDYSDYRVHAIFTTKEKAEEYKLTIFESSIQEFLLDPLPNQVALEIAKSGDKLWNCAMNSLGDFIYGYVCPFSDEYTYGWSTVVCSGPTQWNRRSTFNATVRAATEEEAIKIMNRYRIILIAENSL